MIDYEKLKIAHDMAFKITKNSEPNYMQVRYRFVFDSDEFRFYAELGLNYGRENLEFRSIDDLISKLKELTKRLPKYEIGQEVYYLYQLKRTFLPLEISEINPIREDGRVTYRTGNGMVFEEDIYPSEDALIDAQIDYWKKLKMQSISESNG